MKRRLHYQHVGTTKTKISLLVWYLISLLSSIKVRSNVFTQTSIITSLLLGCYLVLVKLRVVTCIELTYSPVCFEILCTRCFRVSFCIKISGCDESLTLPSFDLHAYLLLQDLGHHPKMLPVWGPITQYLLHVVYTTLKWRSSVKVEMGRYTDRHSSEPGKAPFHSFSMFYIPAEILQHILLLRF